MLKLDKSFSFETVMSHPSKLNYLERAKRSGFKIYFYFICTSDPAINVSRVQNRVFQGGHDVEVSKISTRYFRCLELLYDAFSLADRAFIIDTTFGDTDVIIEKNDETIKIVSSGIPEWVNDYLIKKIN
jgi:predicted ABC-type ATPase